MVYYGIGLWLAVLAWCLVYLLVIIVLGGTVAGAVRSYGNYAVSVIVKRVRDAVLRVFGIEVSEAHLTHLVWKYGASSYLTIDEREAGILEDLLTEGRSGWELRMRD